MKSSIQKYILIAIGINFLILVSYGANNNKVSDAKLKESIQIADRHRGYFNQGFSFNVQIDTVVDSEVVKTYKFEVRLKGDNSLILTKHPISHSGQLMVGNKHKMWKIVTGSKMPILMDQAQRLTGVASIGDVVGTRFFRDFSPSELPLDPKKPDYQRVSLKAASNEVLYDKINVLINKAGLVTYADIYAANGENVLKTVEYFYDQEINVGGKPMKIISSMKIRGENANEINYSHVKYDNYKMIEIDEKEFDLKQVLFKYRGVPIK